MKSKVSAETQLCDVLCLAAELSPLPALPPSDSLAGAARVALSLSLPFVGIEELDPLSPDFLA